MSQQHLLLLLACFHFHGLCLAFFVSAQFHNDSSADRKALLCLKSQLHDPSEALASWGNESLAVCNWKGVTCSNSNPSRVVALDLESQNITGQIFPCVAGLSFVSRIHMPGNQLNGQISPEVGQLTRLRYLNLSLNSLTGEIPATISSCSLLEIVDLFSNSIEEYGLGCKVSTEGDVYSYGIIVLEMITGKRPTDEMFQDGVDLRSFVESAFPDQISDILEPTITEYHEGEDPNHVVPEILTCAIQLAKLGLMCTETSPKDRPTMDDVYYQIISIKEKYHALIN